MDYLQAHKDKQKELSELNTRRDTDRELVTSYKYVMKDSKDKEVADLVNVTMNRLKVFKAYVEASLNKADEKVVVESDDTSLDTALIEDFVKRGFASANRKLATHGGEESLEQYFDEQACIRGEVAARVLFQFWPAKGGKKAYFETDITAWDTRFVTYERGTDGFAWGGYEGKKTKGAIESEDWAVEKGFAIAGKAATVIDLWAPDQNLVYVDGKLVSERENPFGSVPICVQRVPIGSMLADEGNLKYRCESIFFLVRDLIDEYNRCMSILQTLNLKAIKAAVTQVTEGEASEYDELTAMGSNTPTKSPNPVSIVPYGEARRAMVLALQEINNALDDGTLSRITLGDLPGEMSAVALIQIEQGQGQVFMPRLGTRGREKEQIAEMFIAQTIASGQSVVEIGTPGHKKPFKVSDLEGEYDITFKYSNKSPETDFARLSMARQYKEAGLLDELSILRDIMKRDDPEGDLNKLFRQRLRSVCPNLQMYDGLMALAKMYENGDESAKDEIAIIEAQLGVSLEQVMSGQLPPPEAETPKAPESSLPLIAGGGRSSPQKAADLERTPLGEEGGE